MERKLPQIFDDYLNYRITYSQFIDELVDYPYKPMPRPDEWGDYSGSFEDTYLDFDTELHAMGLPPHWEDLLYRTITDRIAKKHNQESKNKE